MHLNGGRDFSELHYEVLADGEPTKIVRRVRTDGSPGYLKTVDCFICGDDVFDVLATKGVGLKDWLLSHVSRAGEDATPTGGG